MTSATIVWWCTVKYKTSRAKFDALQRLACLGITVAIRTSRTAAVEVLVGLSPLHVKTEVGPGQVSIDSIEINSRSPDLHGMSMQTCLGT
jgi:hypothetical protein